MPKSPFKPTTELPKLICSFQKVRQIACLPSTSTYVQKSKLYSKAENPDLKKKKEEHTRVLIPNERSLYRYEY